MRTDETTAAVTHLLLVEAGDRRLSFIATDVVEVVPIAALLHPTESPSVFAGFLNLGGELVPVIRTERLIAASDIPLQVSNLVVIIRHKGGMIGLIVSKATQFVLMPPSTTAAPIECLIAQKAILIDGCIVPIVCPERILLEQEQQRIAVIKENEMFRLTAIEKAAS